MFFLVYLRFSIYNHNCDYKNLYLKYFSPLEWRIDILPLDHTFKVK